MAYEKCRETLQELSETIDDVRAEVEEKLTEASAGDSLLKTTARPQKLPLRSNY